MSNRPLLSFSTDARFSSEGILVSFKIQLEFVYVLVFPELRFTEYNAKKKFVQIDIVDFVKPTYINNRLRLPAGTKANSALLPEIISYFINFSRTSTYM